MGDKILTNAGDRELLEMAAKAAGIKLWWAMDDDDCNFVRSSPSIPNDNEPDRINWRIWNPLTDDGDALRLAVKLNILITNDDGHSAAQALGVAFISIPHNGDPYAATRRSIVRAAAAIGAAK